MASVWLISRRRADDKGDYRERYYISLGGYVAERVIFGEQWTSSGVSYDIEEATRLANRAIRKGMPWARTLYT